MRTGSWRDLLARGNIPPPIRPLGPAIETFLTPNPNCSRRSSVFSHRCSSRQLPQALLPRSPSLQRIASILPFPWTRKTNTKMENILSLEPRVKQRYAARIKSKARSSIWKYRPASKVLGSPPMPILPPCWAKLSTPYSRNPSVCVKCPQMLL